ncbi:MAG TPA: hypothetical protein VK465_09030, partial [Fibrobacteria bacterium]|nr:hypothetical protein [Fibrobacteria bacterium]
VISYVEHTTVDHVWSEMHPKGVKADGMPVLHGEDVIMDGWSKEKVAILREDSEYARLDKRGRADHLQHDEPLNQVTGRKARNILEKFKTQVANSPFLQGVFDQEFHRLVAENFDLPKEELWNDTSVFHADFLGRTGTALRKNAIRPSPIPGADPFAARAKRASLAEIQAVGVARSLGSNVRGAIADAPGIIASAKRMFPNPEKKN